MKIEKKEVEMYLTYMLFLTLLLILLIIWHQTGIGRVGQGIDG